MKPARSTTEPGADWQGLRPARSGFRWSDVLWALIFPARSQRITPTVPGLVLIGLALGIGSAAYNSASNILFITLSLLLACLILSGVMSWLNLRGVCWRLLLAPPWRAGQPTAVTLELWNRKRLIPTYGLWFDLGARPAPAGPRRPESTVTTTAGEFRAAWARIEQSTVRTVLPLRERLDPDGQMRLDWLLTPPRRGVMRVELTSVGSLYPFGFLRKQQGTRLRREVVVWPAPVDYRFTAAAAAQRATEGERVSRPGAGNDLLALRRYQAGDSHRLIHWKASARLRQLLVRQFAAESAAGFFLWVETGGGRWTREEQFELLCRLAATLAEDLFTEGRLRGAAIDAGVVLDVRRVRDLESLLDRLALLEWTAPRPPAEAVPGPGAAGSGGPAVPRRNLITFAPDGARGVAAYVDGRKTATA
jgi:uncharacterized protein (DUF58 family)